MLNKPLLIIGSLVLLVSCGENWDKEADEQIKHPEPKPQSEYYYEPILENETVAKETLLTNVQSGDALIITFSGKKFAPIFSNTYTRRNSSNWTVRRCITIDPITRARVCHNIRRSGYCDLKYRDYGGLDEQDIIFNEDIELTKLRIRIGDNYYPVGKVTKYTGLSISTEFVVSDAMLQESNEASITVLPIQLIGNVRTGFIAYGSCQGRGQRGFSHRGSTKHKVYKNQITREFKVNVSFKRLREVN